MLLILTVGTTPELTRSAEAVTATYLQDGFARADGLVTNAYAHASPTSRTAVHDGRWEMTSGSLFASGGAGWTGSPDAGSPNDRSSQANGSAVFRMRSHRADIADAEISFRLRTERFVTTSRTPATAWDGVHVWLRYQSEDELYAVSVNRRDNKVAVKRKVPGVGTSNGGTYLYVGKDGDYTVPWGSWQSLRVLARDNSDGSVTIELYADGRLVHSVVDRGLQMPDGSISPPLRRAGRVGIRGDNAEFRFDDVSVRPLSQVAVPQHTVVRIGVARSTVYGSALPLTAKAWRDGVPLNAASVRLQRMTYGASRAWEDVARVATDAQGVASFTPVAGVKSYWRAKVPASASATEAVSPSAIVSVRAKVHVKSSAYSVQTGQAVTLSGQVTPATSGHPVYLQRLVNGTWKTHTTAYQTSTGAFAKSVVPPATTQWRVLVPRFGAYDTSTSGTITVTVT